VKKVLLAVTFALFLISPAVAQEPSLTIGGFEMHIGSPQTAVMVFMRKNYDVQQFTSPDSFLIFEHRQNPNGDWKSVGQVSFRNGKLIAAEKDWYRSYVGPGYKIVDALHAVLAQLERDGYTEATIHTDVVREPNTNIQSIRISFGKKWVDILLGENNGGKEVSVTESIRFAPLPK